MSKQVGCLIIRFDRFNAFSSSPDLWKPRLNPWN